MSGMEIKFKPEGHYLGKCHQWVGEPTPPGRLPGWSATSSCWWIKLDGAGPHGGRWIIAGFDRTAVWRAALAKLAEQKAL